MRDSDTQKYHGFVRRVTSALRRRCGVLEGARLVIGVSGGADSVALVRALAEVGPRRGWNLEIAVGHVQHHLRDAAEDDAAFVTELADRLKLPYLRADLDLPSGGNIEAAARRQRYDALAEMARAFEAGFVATAHHGDDQLETMLMRMLRGASVKGLGGMTWRRPIARGSAVKLIRPMLAADHAQAIDYLQAIGETWREDHTNADRTRTRARLRAEVLPALKALDGDATGKAVRLADHLRDAARVLEEAIDRAADHVVVEGSATSLDRLEAMQLPRAVLTGLLRRLLIEAGVGADRLGRRTLTPIIRAVRDNAGGERRFAVGGGGTVTVERTTVRITSPPHPA